MINIKLIFFFNEKKIFTIQLEQFINELIFNKITISVINHEHKYTI